MEDFVGLNYGAYPEKIARTLKISIEEATQIFERYHNMLYEGITKFREEVILPTAKEEGRIHLGLGCYMHTDNPEKDVRTLFNACSQFWSILTLITINEMHHLIDENGLEEDIKVISSIYDSIYFLAKEDAETIKWLNDQIVPIMTTDFIEDQIVHNEATGEIGYNWSDLVQVPNNSSLKEIEEVLKQINH